MATAWDNERGGSTNSVHARPSRQCRQVLSESQCFTMGTTGALHTNTNVCKSLLTLKLVQQGQQGYRHDDGDQEDRHHQMLSKTAQGRSTPFPRRLLAMIRREATRNPLIVRWSPDGRAFFVDDDDVFVTNILPVYGFKASKMQSFQVTLNFK